MKDIQDKQKAAFCNSQRVSQSFFSRPFFISSILFHGASPKKSRIKQKINSNSVGNDEKGFYIYFNISYMAMLNNNINKIQNINTNKCSRLFVTNRKYEHKSREKKNRTLFITCLQTNDCGENDVKTNTIPAVEQEPEQSKPNFLYCFYVRKNALKTCFEWYQRFSLYSNIHYCLKCT